MLLYLARHGETAWNLECRFQGHTDVPLSEAGRAQARLLAARLESIPFAAIWSSDMSRSLETAAIIAERRCIEVVQTPLLRETMLGEWEGLTEADILARGDQERLHAYRRDSIAHRPPGGEPLEAVWARVLCARDRIRLAHPGETVLIVGHGGSLKTILCDARGEDVRGLRGFALANASLSLVEYDADRTLVHLVNDTSHLFSPPAG